MNLDPAKRLIKGAFNRVGLNVSRIPRARNCISPRRFDELFQKYQDRTMLGHYHYVTNLALTATARQRTTGSGVVQSTFERSISTTEPCRALS